MDRFMRRAFALAKMADPSPNPMVGAVLVKGGRAIGEGHHRKAGMPHAEIEAIKDAEKKGHSAAGCTLYTSLEPCSHTNKRTPPCTRAIIAAGIRKVVYAMKDPNPLVSGAKVLSAAGLEVLGPTDEEAGKAMNRKYVSRIASRPLVAIKMAMSADGKTATRTGDSKWISCIEEREWVAKLRSEFDAVMVGQNTVEVDDPRLTARTRGGRNPLRIVVDGKLSVPERSRILHNPDGKTIVATCAGAPQEKIRRLAENTEAHVFVCGKREVDLRALVEGLAGMGVKKILIEGGSEMNAKALEAGIVDRLYFCIAPKIIGGRDAKPVIGGRGIERMSEAMPLKRRKIIRLGCDIVIQYDVSR
ncbi:MAG TPA: bifunctional diaminohydroxyphosphoribosylaminopyrimidine deaminase/5-amino-6-(5-phosphoribosylamino)uracil reductase RibD [Candidatus Bilamarchaeum sp.]|nr:bifunctional diaminohydroxyphosphoribosylaminopyrimidine deaminase/5-amino-6-(5-phosphoribosylamino)uracil reductase RibD [Candidatus Bilamarchaeum sp.]